MKKTLALLALIAFSAVPACAALSVVQAQTNTIASGTAVTVTITSTSGNLLVIATTEGANNTATVTISDSASQTWTQAASGYSGATSGSRFTIFYIPHSSSVTSVTATWSGSLTTDVDGIVYEISGAATSSVEDASVNSSAASGTSATSGSLTTSNANDILIFALRIKGNYTGLTAGSGYTIPSNGTQQRSASEYKIVSATQSSVTATFTWTGSFGNQATFIALKAAGSPAMPPAVY